MNLMYVDGVALGLVLIYGIMGYRYGLTGALINLAGMVGGYVAAVYYARPIAVELAGRTGIAPIFALPLASLFIFLLVTRAFYLLHLLVRKVLQDDKSGPSSILTMDKVGGLGFGLLKGTAIVGLLLWGLPNVIGSGALAGQVGLGESQVAGAVRSVIETAGRYGFGYVTDDTNAQAVMARAVAQPRVSLQAAANLVANPAVKTCLADAGVQQSLHAQDFAAVVSSRRFDAVLQDDAVQQELRTLGFQPNGARVSREDVGRAVVPVAAQLKTKLGQLQSSPATQEIQGMLADPTVQEHLRKGEVGAVLKDPRLARALGIDPAAAQPNPRDARASLDAGAER